MKIEALTDERIQDFINYSKKHKTEVDDSFLNDMDFKDFKCSEENPTYIVENEAGDIIAAASLIINDYYRRGRMGRFRIFHSEIEDINIYNKLLQNILKHTEGLDKVIVFIPMVNTKMMELMEILKFNAERYSFIMVREDSEVPASVLPEGYEIRVFRLGKDEEAWCEVRNAGFAKLKGSETPMTPKQVTDMMTAEDIIEGGSMLLYHKDRPVGVVRGTKDDYEGSPIMCIGPLAIIPEYQGKGLGRSLLRAIVRFAGQKGYKKTILCVNAENERAKALYLQEGFAQVEATACYKYDLKY